MARVQLYPCIISREQCAHCRDFCCLHISGLYNAGETIRLTGVMTNIGGHYDPSKSVFTCPFTGTYYFNFCLYAYLMNNGAITSAYIQLDGERLSQAYCRKDGSDTMFAACCNSVVITLSARAECVSYNCIF